MVTRVAAWLAGRGVQICGHDLIPGLDGTWRYIESNAYPGYLVLLATHGIGTGQLVPGYWLGGQLIAQALEQEFAPRI